MTGTNDGISPRVWPPSKQAVVASAAYARDVGEVLFLNRVRGSTPERRTAGDAATFVRQARFHAHATVPDIDLHELVAQLADQPVSELTLPGPRPDSGVGNANYYSALAAVVRAVDPATVLEFGTYVGLGTLTIALNSGPGCRIVTVDLPDEASLDQAHGLNEADLQLIERIQHRVGEAFGDSEAADRITQIRADSLTWRAEESVSSVDLVLIDGGHSTPVVKADTDNARRVLAEGGTILWDDYFHLYPDVVDFIDALAAEGHPVRNIAGTNLVISSPRLS